MGLYLCRDSGVQVDQVLMLKFTDVNYHSGRFPVTHDRTLKQHELATAPFLVLHALTIVEANITSLKALVNDIFSLLMGSPFPQKIVRFISSQLFSKTIISQLGVEIHPAVGYLPSAKLALAPSP